MADPRRLMAAIGRGGRAVGRTVAGERRHLQDLQLADR